MYKQELLLLSYNSDVECVIEKVNYTNYTWVYFILHWPAKESLIYCKKTITPSRRSLINGQLPSYEPYLPTAKNGVFYNCSSLACQDVQIYSITQLAFPRSTLKYCFLHVPETYQCETVKYYYYKNIDKLLFLSNNIPNKIFYLIDCLAYSDGGRVCLKKDDVDSHTKLVDIGNVARPNESNILSQEEFICEQSEDKTINCDLDLYVPYSDGLKEKESFKADGKILLKTDDFVVTLNYNCIGSWCGYSGAKQPTRRATRYEPPGGKVYRCYYAKKQQICKEIYGSSMNIYNERDWLSS